MSEIPSTARVVVIGGGAVGASCLYHLGLKGWTDCLLIEKNELTCGSTWHAAGNVPTFSASWSVMNMQRYSTELYRGLGERVAYPMNYHVTGSLRLAHSMNRMMEFEHVVGMGRYQDLDVEICSVADLKDRYPFLETHDLAGGLYDPYDGDIDPAQLTQALAKGARDLGNKIVRFCTLKAARRENDEWVLTTDHGDIHCQYVVNAAGYRAQEVGAMFGRFVPMISMSHQYLMTEAIGELSEYSKQTGGKLPLLRDVDSSYYLRQEKDGFNLGPYESNCKAHWITHDDPMPADFSFQLFPDDLERIGWYVEDAMARVPLLATGGVSKIINGPIPYAPDGNPLIGPMPGVPDAFEACVFTFGIAQAGGAGKVLSEWVVEGGTEWDMWSCDPRRFGGYADQDYATQKAMEVYGHEYAMHFPHFEWPAGRGKRLSPLHERLSEQGAQMGVYGGWERANWFAAQGDDISAQGAMTWRRDGPWEPRVREECEAVRDAVAVLDMPGFSRFEVRGQGASAWLRSQVTGSIARPGRIGLAYIANEQGRIVTEFSVMRFETDHFWLITAASAESHDEELLRRSMPGDAGFALRNRTEEYGTLLLAGPKSRDILAGLGNADLTSGWLTHQQAELAGCPVTLIRVSFTGELGWEIHTPIAHLITLYDALAARGKGHGLKPFGMFALDSLRLEKGYRAWKGDLSTDYTMLEGGLERFVKFDKGSFPGRSALLREAQAGPKKKFVTLAVEAGACDAPYMSMIWHGRDIAGETTSGGWGYRVDHSIAFGMVRADLAVPGTELEVEIYGERCRAVVQPGQAMWDPDNKRLRA
ncbi:MAG: FAD-dependent oxidoreductase [Gammaproteobacteria bacterium]|nr:FAD-dependent oxidoreductase [Gammaproteobacteria bacterium]